MRLCRGALADCIYSGEPRGVGGLHSQSSRLRVTTAGGPVVLPITRQGVGILVLERFGAEKEFRQPGCVPQNVFSTQPRCLVRCFDHVWGFF